MNEIEIKNFKSPTTSDKKYLILLSWRDWLCKMSFFFKKAIDCMRFINTRKLLHVPYPLLRRLIFTRLCDFHIQLLVWNTMEKIILRLNYISYQIGIYIKWKSFVHTLCRFLWSRHVDRSEVFRYDTEPETANKNFPEVIKCFIKSSWTCWTPCARLLDLV